MDQSKMQTKGRGSKSRKCCRRHLWMAPSKKLHHVQVERPGWPGGLRRCRTPIALRRARAEGAGTGLMGALTPPSMRVGGGGQGTNAMQCRTLNWTCYIYIIQRTFPHQIGAKLYCDVARSKSRNRMMLATRHSRCKCRRRLTARLWRLRLSPALHLSSLLEENAILSNHSVDFISEITNNVRPCTLQVLAETMTIH